MQIQKPGKSVTRKSVLVFILGVALIIAFIPAVNLIFHSSATGPVINAGSPFAPPSSCSGVECETAIIPVTMGDTIVVVWANLGVQNGAGFDIPNFITIVDNQTNNLPLTVIANYNEPNNYGESYIFTGTASATGHDEITIVSYDGGRSDYAYDVTNTAGAFFNIYTAYGSSIGSLGSTGVSFAAYSGNTCATIPTFNSGWNNRAESLCTTSTASTTIGDSSTPDTSLTVTNPASSGQALAVLNIGLSGPSGCVSCIVTTGTTTFPTTYTTVIGGTTVVDGTKTINGTTYTIPAGSTTTIGGTTFIRSGNTTETYTSTIGSTFVETQTTTTSTTATQTVLNAPSPDSFSFWAIPLMFNMIFAMLFIAIPAALKVSSGYLYGLLFFSGLTMGGMFGLLAHVTPWEDPLFCGVITGAILATRIL